MADLLTHDEIIELSQRLDCPNCGGDLIPLGCLGFLLHFRCRQCGATANTQFASTELEIDNE